MNKTEYDKKEMEKALYQSMMDAFTQYNAECQKLHEIQIKIQSDAYADKDELRGLLLKCITIETEKEKMRQKSHLTSKTYLDFVQE